MNTVDENIEGCDQQPQDDNLPADGENDLIDDEFRVWIRDSL